MAGLRHGKTKAATRRPSRGWVVMPDALASPASTAPDFTIVAIGASAGGLEACTKLLNALPADTGMAFILVQHLDPTHDSMMVDLLAGHTRMPVVQAVNGMAIARDHLYIIPPGRYLSIAEGALVLSSPAEKHGARLPFDFLLRSLAEECGARGVCVVLSGTGADGSLGLMSVKAKGGLIIAQEPDEAGYAGMPRSAIATGAVDLVARVADMPAALARHANQIGQGAASAAPSGATDWLAETIALLRTRTVHDFSLYKRGTLERRIERRMGMVATAGDTQGYLEMLRRDPAELELLAKDLLINVTSFFRDPKVFDLVAAKIIPEMIANNVQGQPLRIWIAGCSTGEETYTLTMLIHECIAEAKSPIKLQVFASDVDPDAIAVAREGLYPFKIETDISPERLARFFTKEELGYRVMPELRAAVVFTEQDVLADPPFSRLDLVSCRNLLIYLLPEAQARVLSLFHFALRQGGILLLGSAETPGDMQGRFEVISKSARLYRHIGRGRPGEFSFLISTADGARLRAPPLARPPAPQADLGELGRRKLLESYAPAAIIINHRHDCLFLFGPIDRYLRVGAGLPTSNLLSMALPGMRTKLRAAVQRAIADKGRVRVNGGRTVTDGAAAPFDVEVQPLAGANEDLLLVCFLDTKNQTAGSQPRENHGRAAEISDIERELDATRTELQGAIHDLELSNEEQKTINEEALSVNEEFQSTNEELMTSKEELQSLNEELTALNSQLQETLERQRTTSDDLQNVLYSTDVATLFLDTELKIRFFTPATKSLFSVIAGDIGRPLADLRSLAPDPALPADMRAVLDGAAPIDREIEAPDDVWFRRRVLPYRTHHGGIEGVVITFTDITRRKISAKALEAAKHQADLANTAKSRFLAAASHDLRQPLQALALLQGLLEKTVTDERERKLLFRLKETLGAMSEMLDTLLDINQIEAGIVRGDVKSFAIEDVLARLRDEFSLVAAAQGLTLRSVPCGSAVRSDPRLLEQMIRNLLSNALKYTRRGKVLLGCRRRGAQLSIEIWDTGIGIPQEELQAIFEEYHQLENAARERSLGLGLGLSIVKRLADLLGHRVRVHSRHGRGSMFAIEVERVATEPPAPQPRGLGKAAPVKTVHTGAILIVEDDPEIRELLELSLQDEGHRTAIAHDGRTALELVADGAFAPDIIVADYNLPGGLNGLQLARALQDRLAREIPVIVLTGDISSTTLRAISLQNCVPLSKPMKLQDLTAAIQTLLSPSAAPAAPNGKLPAAAPAICIVDDNDGVRHAMKTVLEDAGFSVLAFPSSEAFLAAYHPGQAACLFVDAYLPGMSGLDLLRRLHDAGDRLPAIMITGNSDVPIAVQAMKAGAVDFIEKPVSRENLLTAVARAMEQARDSSKLSAWREDAAQHLAGLTARQKQIMDMVLAGHASKNIAADLGISQRTVENHRAAIMRRTGAASLPALARLAVAAASNEGGGAPEPLPPALPERV